MHQGSGIRFGFVLLAIVFSTLTTGLPIAEAAPSACPSCVADFAVYDPADPSTVDGVWSYETQSLQKMFAIFGWTSKVVDAHFINDGKLGKGAQRRFRALIMPGGFSVPRTQALAGPGVHAIDAFVASGGNYLSFCAGSFYASTTDVWADKASGVIGGKTSYNRPQDYLAYPNLPRPGFFKGRAQGPYGWFVWNDGQAFQGWEPASLDTRVPALQAIGAPSVARFMYYGGPFFEFAEKPRDLEIWARSIAPAGIPREASTGAGKPTIVRFSYGEGKVTLFSYHPVFLLGGTLSGASVQDKMPVSSLHRDTAPFTADDMNYQSWNVLHAALQLATGDSPTRLDRAAVAARAQRLAGLNR